MRRVGLVVGLLGVGLFAACGLVLWQGVTIRGPILNSLIGRGVDAPTEEVLRSRYRVPDGFRVDLFAVDLPNARFLRFSPGGALILSQPREGRLVQVLPDRDGDGRSDGHRVLIADLDRPHGFDFRAGHLYVGESGAVARVPILEAAAPDGPAIELAGPVERIVQGLPEGGNHWTRTVRFGPDDGLYVSVGSSCNVCEEKDPRRAALLRYAPDGSGEEIYAAGLRNAVGFDWRPATGELYATDNGRDLLGDDFPPCELNRIVRGGFYGWPYANGDNVPDPDLGDGHQDRIDTSIPPVHGFRAHNAPLGIHFLRHPDLPEPWRGAALVALHGSWNRSELDGYKVVSLHWDARGRVRERDFLTGFERDGHVIGRPVDVAEGPDGALYVSDDYAGVVYRITWGELAATAARAKPPASPAPPPPDRAPAKKAPGDPLAALEPAERSRLAERGAALFAANACAGCHVPGRGEPGVVVKPLEGLATRHDVDGLVRFFLTPTPPMPVYDLPEPDRRALAVYLLEEHP